MANLKFSQFTEQTDTANVQFIVGYNGAANVRISPANIIGGTVTSVTTGDSNTITIGGTAADPTVAANTAAVTNGSLNLATGDQIYDFVINQGYTTSFNITGTSGTAQTITDGNTITLAQGTGISTVAGATDTVTITNTLPFNSLTLAGDSGASQSITNNNTITLAGGTGLSSVASATDTITFNANVDGTQTTPANTSTTTAARTYKVQVDSSDNLVVNVPWTSGSGSIAGSLADDQVAFGNGTDTIAGSDDFAWNGNTLTLGGSTGTGNLSAVLVTGDAMTCNTSMNLGIAIQHLGDPNTKFGFPGNDTFTIETNGLERLRIASAGQIGIGGTNYGTSGDVLTSNGPASAPSWQAAGGSYTPNIVSGLTTASKDNLYIFTASATLILPGSPSGGDSIKVSNLSGTTTCVIARNGSNIMAVGEDMTLDNQYASFELIYGDTTRGWVIVGGN